MSETVPRENGLRGCDVGAAAEAVALAAVGVAVVAVPVVMSSKTPYVLDVKYLWSGGCALAAGLALLVRHAAGAGLAPKTAALARVLGMFLIIAVLSSMVSGYAAVGLRETWWYAAHVIVFLATAVACRRRAWAKTLIAVMLLVAGFVAVYGCLQAVGVDLSGKTWSKETGPIELGKRGVRVLGTVGLETELGGYMAACGVLALGVALAVKGVEVRLLSAGLALLMLTCMVLSGSRGPVIAFLVGLFVLALFSSAEVKRWLLSRSGKVTAVVVVLVAVAWGAVFVPRIWPRMRRLPWDASIRTTIWRSALAMAADSPVLGKGPGTFTIHFADFRPDDYWTQGVSPITFWAHCEYLDVLVDTGTVGLMVFAVFVGMLAVQSVRCLWSGRDGGERWSGIWSLAGGRGDRPVAPTTDGGSWGAMPVGRGWLLAVFAALVTLLVHATFQDDTRYPTCRLVLWVLMGLVAALWDDAEPKQRKVRGFLGYCGAGFAAILAVSAAVVVWQSQVRLPYEAREQLRMAEDLQQQKHWAESVESARWSVALDPLSIPSYYRLANSFLCDGRHKEALEAFWALRRVSPHYSDADVRVGVAWALLGRMNEARDALETAARYGVLPGAFADPRRLTDEELVSQARAFVSKERGGGPRRR